MLWVLRKDEMSGRVLELLSAMRKRYSDDVYNVLVCCVQLTEARGVEGKRKHFNVRRKRYSDDVYNVLVCCVQLTEARGVEGKRKHFNVRRKRYSD
jgi:hypothetical protein